jgi:hypothetical protein
MSNIPKMGQLPTPEITLSDFSMKKKTVFTPIPPPTTKRISVNPGYHRPGHGPANVRQALGR